MNDPCQTSRGRRMGRAPTPGHRAVPLWRVDQQAVLRPHPLEDRLRRRRARRAAGRRAGLAAGEKFL